MYLYIAVAVFVDGKARAVANRLHSYANIPISSACVCKKTNENVFLENVCVRACMCV